MAIGEEFDYFRVDGLSKSFGGLQAVNNVSMKLNNGEIAGLIGPNGAGKTTLFNLITRLEDADKGKIYFNRRYLEKMKPYRIVNIGIARTFQNIRLLPHHTVLDNIKVAYHIHNRYNWLQSVLRLPGFFQSERAVVQKSLEFLNLFGLLENAYDTADSLPYGKQRKLEIARALATEASLLLLDEPAAGLNPQETEELSQLIRKLRDEFHVTILLIDHDMKMMMNLCERIYVLNFGEVIASGTPEEIKGNPAVIEAYLGSSKDGRDS